jgi:hypothetical protein
MARQGQVGRGEGGRTARGGLLKPLEAELAAFSVAIGRLERRGKGREEVFEGCEVSSGKEEDGGMRPAGADARRLAPGLFDN